MTYLRHYEYKFSGGDRVLVKVKNRPALSSSFTGTIVMCTNDFPIVGRQYIVLADNPKEVGLMSDFYPFAATSAFEGELTKIDQNDL